MIAAGLRQRLRLEGDELKPLVAGFLAFFLLLCGYFILRPLREEASITSNVQLSSLFLGTFLGMLVAVPLQAYLFTRFSRRRFLDWTFRFFIMNLLVFALLRQDDEIWVWGSRVFYCWLSVFNLFVVSLFWSFLVDVFRAEQSRRLFGLVATGGSLGAITGSLITNWGIAAYGAVPLFVTAAVLIEAARFVLKRLDQHDRERTTSASMRALGGSLWAGVTAIWNSRYLQLISLFLLLTTSASTFVYFEQRELVAAAWPDDPVARTQFFSRVNLSVQCLTLLLQGLVVAAVIRKFGMKAALLALPFVCMAGFVALGLATKDLSARTGPGLALVVLATFQVAQQSVNRGLATPVRQMLFAPLSRTEKYKAKNFIDTLLYRGGDLLSGLAFDQLVLLGLSLSSMAFVALPICGVWLLVASTLGRRTGRTSDRSPLPEGA